MGRMQTAVRERARDTGLNRRVTDETIVPANVESEKNAKVTVRIDTGPIDTSGSFEGEPTLSLSEPCDLTGIPEKEIERPVKGATPWWTALRRGR